jgi:3'(2'), 5'-bisphosphate nucleotidase
VPAIADIDRLQSAADRSRLLESLASLVRDAHVEIMRVYAQPFEAELKADQSPLTEADLASHRVLTAGLSRLTPQLPVVSEEGGLPPADERAAWPAYWLIDPLDGTKEFLAKNGEFTVNVALVERSRATLGVVGVPARDQVYIGDVARGLAERHDASGVTPLRARRYAGANPTVVASRRHGGEALEGALKRLEASEGVPVLRNVGSAPGANLRMGHCSCAGHPGSCRWCGPAVDAHPRRLYETGYPQPRVRGGRRPGRRLAAVLLSPI